MTAEVVVMNKLAVALAADSAVTIQGQKILNSANKLFMLAPGYPVGILVFNNAELMGVPWEILIHLYRTHLIETGKRFSNLEEYPKDFVAFLQGEEGTLFNEDQQRWYVEAILDGLFYHDIQQGIFKKIEKQILTTAAKLVEQEIIDISLNVIEEKCIGWEQAGDLPVSRGEVSDNLTKKYETLFNEKYEKYLGGLPLPPSSKERLWNLFISWFTKDLWFLQRYTGIAFAGFGDDDVYPRLALYRFENFIEGNLKHKCEGDLKVGPKENIAAVVPLAQDDIVRSFIEGVHPKFTELLKQHVNDFGNVSDKLYKQMDEEFTSPIINIVASLPKDELANMAETLVSMTSFMRRVSSNLETVGGPIDVAVISKKDGFVWIDRKHYFKREQNYHFFDEKRSLHQKVIGSE